MPLVTPLPPLVPRKMHREFLWRKAPIDQARRNAMALYGWRLIGWENELDLEGQRMQTILFRRGPRSDYTTLAIAAHHPLDEYIRRASASQPSHDHFHPLPNFGGQSTMQQLIASIEKEMREITGMK